MEQSMHYGKLWLGLGLVVAGSFAVLGYFGGEIYRQAPPVPQRVITADGNVLFTGQDIKDGQNVWQSLGGQEVGSIWGHGAYVAPDWSADFLHREATWILDRWAQEEHQTSYGRLDEESQAALQARLRKELRTNRYDAASGDLVVSPLRAEAIEAVGHHYAGLFGDAPEQSRLRDAYAIPAGAIKSPERQKLLNTFFFWASWACVTDRPGSNITLHAKLASRAARGQRADRGDRGLVGAELCVSAGRDRRLGLVLRGATRA